MKFKILPSSWRRRDIPIINASLLNLMLNFRAISLKRTFETKEGLEKGMREATKTRGLAK